MVSCTTIEAQIVFEMLLALVAGQLAIAGQLGREVHLQSIVVATTYHNDK